MKIAIVGSMGVGKTTLAKALGQEIGMRMLPEVARELIRKGYKLDQGITSDLEYEIIKLQAELEKGSWENWIADRCLIDALAYSSVLFPQNIPLIKVAKRELDRAKYDIIIYIPIEFEIENDGVRSTDGKFQREIDGAIKKVLKNHKHFIIKGSVEKRVERVIKIISLIQNHDQNS